MPKRNRNTTEATIARRIKECRGQGHGAHYKPWLHIQDVPSQGLAHRVKGWKTGRVHHLLSRLEQDYFLLLDWSPAIRDIREQFPLLPLEKTQAIADQCGIRHPIDPKTRQPVVMTRAGYFLHLSTKAAKNALITLPRFRIADNFH